jgi:hypothetical protein
MFESEAMTDFMRGAVQAWEYSRLHLEHWRQQQVPGVRYVSSPCVARCDVESFRTRQSSLQVVTVAGSAATYAGAITANALLHAFHRCHCATMPVWSTS